LEQEKELNPDAREPKANNNLLTKAEELAKDKCKLKKIGMIMVF